MALPAFFTFKDHHDEWQPPGDVPPVPAPEEIPPAEPEEIPPGRPEEIPPESDPVSPPQPPEST